MMAAAETGSGPTILVVDDEPTILTMARYVLEPKGYTVLGAFSAREALEVFSEQHPEIDVVLIDFMLPDMLGDELMAKMQEIDSSVPFIAASGCSEREISEEMRAGAASFIRKPFDLKALSEQIDDVLTAAAG